MPYREASFRAVPAKQLSFVAGTYGDVLVALFGLALTAFVAVLLPHWIGGTVAGSCDRLTCRIGNRSIPLARIAYLEREVDPGDSDSSATTTVVARLDDGSRLDFGVAWTNMDDDEKLAFVASFEAFQHGDAPVWRDAYGSTAAWFESLGSFVVAAMVLGWVGSRRRFRLTRLPDRIIVERRFVGWRWRAANLPLDQIVGKSSGREVTIHMRDNSAIVIGPVSRWRRRAIEALLELPEIDS